MDKSKTKKQGKRQSQQDDDEGSQQDKSKQQDSQLFENSQNQQGESQEQEQQDGEDEQQQNDSGMQDNEGGADKQFKKSQFQENEQQDSQFQDENQEGGGGLFDNERRNEEDNFNQDDSNVNQSNFLKNAGLNDNSQMFKESSQFQNQKAHNNKNHSQDFEEIQRKKQQLAQKKKEAYNRAKQLLQPKYNLYDFIFPAGKLAKLVRMHDYKNINDIDLQEVLKKFKVQEGFPVCVFIGAQESNVDRGKFYAGIARACFRTDAVIIDSGLKVGIEKFTMRRNVKLIAVAPENQIKFPKINPTKVDPYELANGHTHIFLIRKQNNSYMKWGEESVLKFDIANQIATGESIFSFKRKVCALLLGDNPDTDYLLELKLAVENQYPILVVPGTDICNDIVQYFTNEEFQLANKEMGEVLDQGHVYILDGNNSEEIASYLHFFLTVTPFKKEKNFEQLVKKSDYRYPHQGYGGGQQQQKSQHQTQNQSKHKVNQEEEEQNEEEDA